MTIHNLDQDVREFFEFVIKGHTYRFRHLNTDEVSEMKKLEDDEEKTKEFLFKFIETTKKDQPEFSEVQKTMILPHWVKFKEMIKTEFGG